MNSREESALNLVFLYCAKTEIMYGEVEGNALLRVKSVLEGESDITT
jgi:hypothetical protein